MFTTVNSTGAPTALSSGGVTVYKNGSTVPDTTGVTLTASFNGVTGQNHLQIDMVTTSAFYAPVAQFMAVISSGAASEDLSGYCLTRWSVGQKTVVSVSSGINVTQWAGNAVTASGGKPDVNVETMDADSVSDTAVSNAAASKVGVAASISNHETDVGDTFANASSQSVIKLTAENASVISISTTAAVQINDEVVDAINTDTYGEPAAGVPSTAASLVGMQRVLYAGLRNQITVSSSAKVFYNDAGGVLWAKSLSQDSTGSTGVYTEAGASTST